MSERKIRAIRVRLIQPAPDGKGGVTYDWSDGTVADLHFFPDAGLARCTLLNGRKIIAACAHADVDPVELEAWESGGDFTCTTCGASFSNAQGLGSHVSKKHAVTSVPAVDVAAYESPVVVVEPNEQAVPDSGSVLKNAAFSDSSREGKRRSR
jgi:hypothetical protein